MDARGPVSSHITDYRDGFRFGYNKFLGMDDTLANTGMEFGIYVINSKVSLRVPRDTEMHLVVLSGDGCVIIDGMSTRVMRQSVFTEKPFTFALPAGCSYVIERGLRDLEVAVIQTYNKNTFEPIILRPSDIPSEQRGEGLLGGVMHREVRAIWGDPMAPDYTQIPESNLVVGEVVNFQGRWSSYPPHYHPHPEVYYYRFDKPEGWGTSYIDEAALIVRNHDAVKILNCTGHAQNSAPGYTMWYLWFIRQLEGNRYEGNPPFTFFPDDEWVLDPRAQVLIPKNIT